MSQSIDRYSEVLYLDFRNVETRPTGPQGLVEYAVANDSRFKATVSAAEGVVHPWNLLLVDVPSGLRDFEEFYLTIAKSLFDFRIVVLVDASAESDNLDNQSLVLPEKLAELRQRVKFIVIGDRRGVLWTAGGMLPKGVVLWERDSNGSQSIEIISDVLRDSSLFDAAFNVMQERDCAAWAIGTRQVWMGKLSGELTQDVFVEVGGDTIGTGWLANRDMVPWVEPASLVGHDAVPGVLISDEVLAMSFSRLLTEIPTCQKSFGITNRRKMLQRVSSSPGLQHSLVSQVKNSVDELVPKINSLVSNIDPSNGFDRDEHHLLNQQGINLRAVKITETENQDRENQFVDGLLNSTQVAIEDGHSVEQIILALTNTIGRITPRSKEKIENQIELAITQVTSAAEVAAKASKSPPGGILLRLGRATAKALSLAWLRYVLFFVYLWVLVAGVFEVIGGENNSIKLWPSVLQTVAHVSAIGASGVLLLIVAVAGGLLSLSDEKIRTWGRAHQFDNLEKALKSLREVIISVATNDWAHYRLRSSIAKQLQGLKEVFEVVAEDINENFIQPFSRITPEELDGQMPNPQVRQDLNARAQGRAFKHMAEIKEILRVDLASMINMALQHTYALRAVSGMQNVRGRVHSDLAYSLQRYVQDGQHFGLLFEHLSTNSKTQNDRRLLAQRIWEEPGLVDDAIRNVVLMGSPIEVVTFVGPDHLRFLSADEDASAELRFFPTHASGRLTAVSNQIGFSPAIISTDSMSAAGVIRLTPFRSNVMEYG